MDDRMAGDVQQPHEYNLLEYIERIERFREGRRAVHIHLSKLKSYNKQDYQLRIAVNTFETLVKMIDGQLFRLSNHDIFFIFANAKPQDIDDAIMRVRYLFTDDPLAQAIEDDSGESFCSFYDIDRQYAEVLTLSRDLYEEVRRRRKRLALIGGEMPGSAQKRAPGGNHMASALANNGQAPKRIVPIDPHRLGELVDAIIRADLSNLMRRQSVCAILGDKPPQFLFRELFISIAELRDLILPNYNLTSNRWLFQYLTETLDKRMLALMLRNDDPDLAQSISLNLNVSTLLSPEFLTFDAGLKPGSRGTVIIELQLIDIYADLSAYAFARDFLHDRGYRICLDGVTDHNLPYVDRERLGVDLVKIQWSPVMAENTVKKRTGTLREHIDRAGKARVILCHVDTPEAIAFGQSLGLVMFQGRLVDQMIPRTPALTRR